MAIILASASPRRQKLLEQVGCFCKVIPSLVKEDNSLDIPPAELALQHAKDKALDIAQGAETDDIVIGADTIVVYQGIVFGKPADEDEARNMLRKLSGREHHVITGVAVVQNDIVLTDFAVTAVSIRLLTDEEIDSYILTKEPFDKAGAYGIQGMGALLIDSICGCYSNVVGLPLVTLSKLLKRVGVELL